MSTDAVLWKRSLEGRGLNLVLTGDGSQGAVRVVEGRDGDFFVVDDKARVVAAFVSVDALAARATSPDRAQR